MRRIVMGLSVVLVLLGAAGPASAAWTRLSAFSDSDPQLVPSAVRVGSTTVVAAYDRHDDIVWGIQADSFGVAPDSTLVGVERRLPVDGFSTLSQAQLIASPTGGQPLLLAYGQRVIDGIDGIVETPRFASGGFGLLAEAAHNIGTRSPGAGAYLAGGRLATPDALGATLNMDIGFPINVYDLSSYLPAGMQWSIPRLAYDRSGRLWLAAFGHGASPTTSGLYVGRVDASTGFPMGMLTRVPDSQADDNRFRRVPLACNAVCHVVYYGADTGLTSRNGLVQSWAPGQPAPVTVATGATAYADLDAGVSANGHVWIAWEAANGSFFARRGDADGAGGTVVAAGAPPHAAAPLGGATVVVPVGEDQLAFVAAYGRPPTYDVWATAVRTYDLRGIPNPVLTRDPRGAAVTPALLRPVGRCVPLKLEAYAATTFTVRLLRGARFTVRVRRALRVRFGAAGTRTVCLTIPREPRLWYARRRFRLSIAFGAGAPHLVPIRIRL